VCMYGTLVLVGCIITAINLISLFLCGGESYYITICRLSVSIIAQIIISACSQCVREVCLLYLCAVLVVNMAVINVILLFSYLNG
jgi:hypothetical protein